MTSNGMIPDRRIPDKVLPACTARVLIAGKHEGTCFFVARGLAVTCFHVIESAELSSGSATSDLTLVDLPGTQYEVTEITKRWQDPDLAVLRFQGPMEPPCVLLDGGIRTRDPLFTYGYSERLPDGAGTALETESWIGKDEVRLKLRDGQVLPGMSGSPALNERTGAVCGIVNRTRDSRQALGGYAISAKELLRLYPKLQSKNRRYHQEDRRWTELLGPDLRRSLISSRRIEQAGIDRVMVIAVRQDGEEWWVDAEIHPEGERLTSVRVDFNSVRKDVARLFRDWALRGRVEEQEQVRLLGRILSSAILPGIVGTRFQELFREADRQRRLLVALRFNDQIDPELVYLPWEHLFVRAEGGSVFFARDQKLAFVRTVESEPAEELEGGAAASVLVVDTAPVDDVDMTRDQRLLMGDITDVAGSVHNDLDNMPAYQPKRMSNPELGALKLEIDEGEYDVVHYVGFGQFQSGGEGDQLALGGVGGGISFVSGDMLAGSLTGGEVRLVVLQLCGSAGGSVVPPDFSELAPSLVGGGIPTVVACQLPMQPSRAQEFNKMLYKRLSDGATIAAAVQEARQSAGLDTEDARSSVSPALFVRQPGNVRLIDPARALAPRTSILAANA